MRRRGFPIDQAVRPLFLAGLYSLVPFESVAADDGPLESRARPEAAATRLAEAPTLDGKILDDSAWAAVTPITGFTQVQPTEGAPATQQTEVRIGFTDDALWVAVVAFDEEPGAMIVSEARRDSSLDETASFRFVVDGLLDRQNGYVFGTNPTGMQYDAQVIKEGEAGDVRGNTGVYDVNWDGSWSVRTSIGDYGWSAEFRIPFRTLRFGTGEVQSWGFNFQRNIRRNNEIVYWAPLGRQYTLSRISRAGTVTGIEVPAQRNLQVTPYVLALWRRDGEGNSDSQEFGFDIKYSITPSLTLDATYNTDFAQVEVDDVVVNLDRFSIFLPEKRPFFLENAGQFAVGFDREIELFFSRRIGIVDGMQVPIEGGVRLSGKVGADTNVGLLYMRDEGLAGVAPSNDYAVARVNRELGTRSAIGAMIVSREGEGEVAPGLDDQNRTYAVDGRWSVGENLLLDAFYAQTETPGLDGDDYAWSAKATYSSGTWSSRLNFTEVREDFNPEVGFLRRDDYRRLGFYLMRRIRPGPESRLLEIRPHTTIRNFWDLDGYLETGFFHYDAHWEFKNGYQLETGYNHLVDGLKEPFEIIDGVFVPAARHSGDEANLKLRTDLSAPLGFEVEAKIGTRFGGNRVVIMPMLRYRLGESFNAELYSEYTSYDLPYAGGDFDVLLSRLRLAYSFTPKASIQAVIQYENETDTLSTNLRFSLLRTARSGLYLVYNEFDERMAGLGPSRREFVIKYNYLFDVLR
ncbi:MAG: DUF5916 domain-containing protein [Woeseiaceae bacterium]|nr:DUF5916 domain-containing protein [Woeseiaceae bacterium]